MGYPPSRGEEAEKERERRRQDLDGDEELARQLAAQLMLTSPAEHEASGNDERLPRVAIAGPLTTAQTLLKLSETAKPPWSMAITAWSTMRSSLMVRTTFPNELAKGVYATS